jgi:hypothetical protein
MKQKYSWEDLWHQKSVEISQIFFAA